MASVDQGHSMSPMRLHHPSTTGASFFLGTSIALVIFKEKMFGIRFGCSP
jgi:hypothetical protein